MRNSMLSLTAVLKPGFVASTRYCPTCRIDGTTNRPSSFVVASKDAPVLMFVTLTDAPTTFAPLESVTRPVMEARSFCATTGMTRHSVRVRTKNTLQLALRMACISKPQITVLFDPCIGQFLKEAHRRPPG